ncbi:hypothetical protein LTR91_026770, partial [Friedmanniomyces endolithicus]
LPHVSTCTVAISTRRHTSPLGQLYRTSRPSLTSPRRLISRRRRRRTRMVSASGRTSTRRRSPWISRRYGRRSTVTSIPDGPPRRTMRTTGLQLLRRASSLRRRRTG